MELRGFFAVSIPKEGQFIQPHATSVLSWDFVILGPEFCEMSLRTGPAGSAFFRAYNLKQSISLFICSHTSQNAKV